MRQRQYLLHLCGMVLRENNSFGRRSKDDGPE